MPMTQRTIILGPMSTSSEKILKKTSNESSINQIINQSITESLLFGTNKATIANVIRLFTADPRQGHRESDKVQLSWGYVR